MPDTNDIDALLLRLTGPQHSRHHAALTALVAERDALLRRNEALVACHGQWAKDFTAVEADRNALVAERDGLKQENNALRSRCKAHQDEVLDRVFEMDALRKRVAELDAEIKTLAAANAILHGRLESQPPADRDRELRERMVDSALRGVGALSMLNEETAKFVGRQAVWMVDGAIAAMRKWEQ